MLTKTGVRTHADIRPLELKSNALTTRPSWCQKGPKKWRGVHLCCYFSFLCFVEKWQHRWGSNPCWPGGTGLQSNALSTRPSPNFSFCILLHVPHYPFSSVWIFDKTTFTRSGDRTHADIRPLELKSNALTTRPSWCVKRMEFVLAYILGSFSDF